VSISINFRDKLYSMKKVLWSTVLLGLLFFATHYALADKTYTWGGNMPVTVTVASPTSATFNIVFPATKAAYTPDVCVSTTNLAAQGILCDPNDSHVAYEQKFTEVYPGKPVTANDTITNLDPTKNYYLIIYGPGTNNSNIQTPVTYTFFTGTESAPDAPVLTSIKDGNDIVVSGKIDTAKYPQYQQFVIKLVVSRSQDLSSPVIGPITSQVDSTGTSKAGISDGTADSTTYPAGSYYWRLKGLLPSTLYYFQATLTSSGGVSKSLVDSVNASNGSTITPGSAAQQADLNQRSYTLLSGFPGFTVLPDPDLCAQERAAGKAPQFCDINDVLNYAIKLLIGITGVVLVLRLMYEGYQYMVSDVPFLKASAKSGFFTALGGLLLAMTSFVILNTINPKLVSETVNVQPLAIDVGGDTNTPTTFVSNGQMPSGVICPNSGRSSAVAQIAPSWKGKVTYSQTNKSSAAGPDGYAVLDCSSFVNTVLKCAGYVPGKDFVNEGTSSIFASAEKVNMSSGFKISGSNVLINGTKLNPGDVIGWPPSANPQGNGHAIIYIGNGTFYDSHGGTSGRQPGNAIGVYTAAQIQQLFGGSNSGETITSVERVPS
jgi:cell wall-associated NlpC family hydrolase